MSVCNMCLVLVFVLMGALREAESLMTYKDLSKLVRENLHMEEKPIVSKSCNAQQCKEFEKMCQNGGKCIVTETCGCRCKCPPGYTGFFCRLKATTTTSGPATKQTTGAGKRTSTTATAGSLGTTTTTPVAKLNKSASDSVIKSAKLDSLVNKLTDFLLKPKKADIGGTKEGGLGRTTPRSTKSTTSAAS